VNGLKHWPSRTQGQAPPLFEVFDHADVVPRSNADSRTIGFSTASGTNKEQKKRPTDFPPGTSDWAVGWRLNDVGTLMLNTGREDDPGKRRAGPQPRSGGARVSVPAELASIYGVSDAVGKGL